VLIVPDVYVMMSLTVALQIRDTICWISPGTFPKNFSRLSMELLNCHSVNLLLISSRCFDDLSCWLRARMWFVNRRLMGVSRSLKKIVFPFGHILIRDDEFPSEAVPEETGKEESVGQMAVGNGHHHALFGVTHYCNPTNYFDHSRARRPSNKNVPVSCRAEMELHAKSSARRERLLPR